ncbi:siderophore-interacting protein [Acidipropionibacterium virtanenii]|uniref:Vibriobactin utilization protein ViuB n=1 Tax=Acidipropionibacterium virtanenii TaxID=2057246 RepID=A0A344URM1_9ACTN|nr:siderophore-interacting protein [Acidipropionibacterium virtanenii]AXE37919.1 Vibriobactin utilization protein ViuB [Acidipropionibacterium virtanenii]
MTTDPRPVAAKGARPFRVQVADKQTLSPHFRRLVFTGEDLDIFGTDGLDQRIKLLFANRDGGWIDLGLDDPVELASGDWYPRWLEADDDRRNPIRTYTVRAIDPVARELTVDFAVHDGAGPGGSFPDRALIGEELVIVGPDSRSPLHGLGIDFHPGRARNLLLAGDETAVPAICSILESLSSDPGPDGGWNVHAFMEVPSEADRLSLDSCEGIHTHWMARQGQVGARLVEEIGSFASGNPEFMPLGHETGPLADVDVDHELLWEAPQADPGADFYAWIAGEAAAVRTLRRLLVAEHGVDRSRIAFMGYWRSGRAEN